jgi:hypothetical protein
MRKPLQVWVPEPMLKMIWSRVSVGRVLLVNNAPKSYPNVDRFDSLLATLSRLTTRERCWRTSAHSCPCRSTCLTSGSRCVWRWRRVIASLMRATVSVCRANRRVRCTRRSVRGCATCCARCSANRTQRLSQRARDKRLRTYISIAHHVSTIIIIITLGCSAHTFRGCCLRRHL